MFHFFFTFFISFSFMAQISPDVKMLRKLRLIVGIRTHAHKCGVRTHYRLSYDRFIFMFLKASKKDRIDTHIHMFYKNK